MTDDGRPGVAEALEAAIEYLEFARPERRDTAAGVVRARELVASAEAGLQAEQPVPLRAEAAVTSYERLRREVTIDRPFRGLYRDVGADLGSDGPAGGLDPETALAVDGVEVAIERSLQGPDDG